MQKKFLLTILILIFGGIIFSSYEHGPAYEGGLNRTGSNGGGANCAGSGCHSANDPSTIVSVHVKNSAGTEVTQYVPGGNYTVTINGHNTTSETLSKFGFQVSGIVVSSGDQAGTFTAVSGSNIRIVTLSGLQIAEHKKPLNETSTNTYTATFNWTAPAAGAGNVAFYGILNPVAGDGHKTTGGGDDDDDDDDDDDETGLSYPNIAPVVTLTQGTGGGNGGTSAVAQQTKEASMFRCYPTPCTSLLTIEATEQVILQKVEIYDMAGRLQVASNTTADKKYEINTSNLLPGVYTLVAYSTSGSSMMQIVKN